MVCKRHEILIRPKAALFYVHWELSELVFVCPSKKSCFQNGSRLRKTMKLNMYTCLEHEYASILTLKMCFDYKRILIKRLTKLEFDRGKTF